MAVKLGALGKTIRAARLKKGYTQEELAEILDITQGHLQHIESERRNPSVPMLFDLMEILDFSVDALVFPERIEGNVLHIPLDRLTKKEAEALARLVDAMKE